MMEEEENSLGRMLRQEDEVWRKLLSFIILYVIQSVFHPF